MVNKSYGKLLSIDLNDEVESVAFAHRLAQSIIPGLIVAFSGEIGAGKTTIIRALLKKLGIVSAIKSPTFSLVESYQIAGQWVHHFDLYRIQHEEELEYLGFRDYFNKDNMCLIEWAEHAGQALPKVDIRFNLTINGTGRTLQMSAETKAGEHIIACMAGEL